LAVLGVKLAAIGVGTVGGIGTVVGVVTGGVAVAAGTVGGVGTVVGVVTGGVAVAAGTDELRPPFSVIMLMFQLA
jgi:hypothetical protein